ncbi:ROK family protein [Runella aurantiaca]|uniref:ROK family protein n=1 Tax=Runella aurantiaca TaxID=2282308 RepID=A0A369I861_9BACT|nr:ROK family protein [Runella aurantiaca]RDB04697.1 ROK family protein [Runella aurantiaca]
MYIIGIDLGGTNVKGIIIDEKGTVLKQHYVATQDNGDTTWRVNVLEMVLYLKNWLQEPVAAIGMSAPGLPDEQNQCIAFLPNRLNGLENFIWSNYLGETSYILNDAHSALMAEATFGVAKGHKNVVLLTLGTGIGGGLLINGQLYQGLSQMAGHLGHLSLNATDDEVSIVGMPGSLEYAIGNYSVAKRSKGRFESTWELVEAYRKGDAWATLIWLSSLQKLAVALSSLVNAFSPELIVLAGGITFADDALFEPLKQFMDFYEWRPGGKKTPIVQAEFGDMAGAIGAAGFAMSKIKNTL